MSGDEILSASPISGRGPGLTEVRVRRSPGTGAPFIPGLLRSLGGQWNPSPPSSVNRVRIDSRQVQPGDLFVALQGENTHGHEFVQDAFERGAGAALVETRMEASGPLYRVHDTLETLQELARVYRRNLPDTFVIGVTGSCGKTTVKEMLYELLRSRYSVGRTPGNYNNHIGLPLTILNQGGKEVLVAECGVNHSGEMDRLGRLLRPDWGVITHIGPSHLEGFGSVESVAREKGKLLESLPRDGLAILPANVRHRDILTRSCVCPVVPVGTAEGPVVIDQEPSGEFLLKFSEEVARLSLSSRGLACDAALSAAIALRLGVRSDVVRTVLESFQPLSGRGRTLRVGGCLVIDGSYNANPSSMSDALSRLAGCSSPRLAVLGEMKELGDRAPRAHRELGRRAAEVPDLKLHYVGSHQSEVREGFEAEGGSGSYYDTIEELEPIDLNQYGSALVKGSHSVGLDRLIRTWTDSS